MKQNKYFPVIYGIISALIAFIAVFFIAQRTFHFSLPMAILSAGIFAAFFYVLSYFRQPCAIPAAGRHYLKQRLPAMVWVCRASSDASGTHPYHQQTAAA